MPFYLLRKMIRRLPGYVIKAVPKPRPAIIDGYGSRGKIGEICAAAGYKSALVVTDKTLYSLTITKKSSVRLMPKI
jgi:alcohol dehydrogenase class IV